MENKKSQVTIGIFKTLYLFLLSHELPNTAEAFRNECELNDEIMGTLSCVSLLIKTCTCSKNEANQTTEESGDYFNNNRKTEWLEGTSENGPFFYKDDDTYVFYVCDHHYQCNDRPSVKIQTIEQVTNISTQISDHQQSQEFYDSSEFTKLKNKFSLLQGEHRKLIAVTSELTTALQVNIIGHATSIDKTLQQCKSIYPSLFDPSQLPFEAMRDHQNDNCLYVLHQNLNSAHKKVCSINEHEEEKNENQNFEENPRFHNDSLKVSLPLENQEQSGKVKEENLIDNNSVPKLRPESGVQTPLTPEVIRNILEIVFDKIFEMQTPNKENGSSQLDKNDVEKIVKEAYQDIWKSSSPVLSKQVIFNENESIRGNYFNIDYHKLKKDLLKEDNDKKIRLLQALRWRITKTDPLIRDKVMNSYISNDVLNINSGIGILDKIPDDFNSDAKILVQESACRLINSLASIRQGRNYLTKNDKLLKTFLIKRIKNLRKVPSTIIINMLVASIQKLSIRKRCRAIMVSEGLFEFLIDYLNENYRKLSKYGIEYCLALLMNLSLVNEARERSIKISKKVINLIIKIFENKHENCLPYMNGMMFILFEKSAFVKEAKNQGLDKLLIKYMQITKNENISNQLDYIVQSRILKSYASDIKDNDDDDDQDEIDLLEIELDEYDFASYLSSGEKLLEDYQTNDHSVDCTLKHSMTFSTFLKNPPNSAKSYSEETKCSYHKPSSLKGIFDKSKPHKFNHVFFKQIPENIKLRSGYNDRLPPTTICYMENCKKLSEGTNACSCSNCVPGQNKYTCGCYDAICKEVADNDLEYNANEAKNRQLKGAINISLSPTDLDKNTSDNHNISNDTAKISNSPNHTPLKLTHNDKGGRTRSACKICGERKCECAFESRPKLNRTPL